MKKSKKIILILLAITLVLQTAPITFAKYTLPQDMELSFCVGDSTLLINGEEKTVETPYIAGYGTTLVPVRVISESFGAVVGWEHETKKIFINYPKNEIVLQIGNKAAEVNGEKQSLEEPPALSKSGTSMVPLRFISEALGATVSYDDDTKRILITKETVIPELQEKKNAADNYISYGNGLYNTYVKLTRDKSLKVGYIGGSVTAGSTLTDNSWRGFTNKWLVQNFPEAEITQIGAGIGCTGSQYGAYRIKQDIIDNEPDLLFIEFAINDRYKGESDKTAKIFFESMVRQVRKALPNCDIVTLLILDRQTANVQTYTASSAHETVANYYGVSVVKGGRYMVDNMGDTSDDTWRRYFVDDVHPLPRGSSLLSEPVIELLHNSLLATDYGNILELEEHELPEAKFGGEDYEDLHILFPNETDFTIIKGWEFNPTYKFHSLENSTYPGAFIATDDNNKLTFTVKARDISLMSAYPGGTVYVSIDGGPEKKISIVNPPMELATNLTYKEHTVTIRAEGSFTFGGVFYR